MSICSKGCLKEKKLSLFTSGLRVEPHKTCSPRHLMFGMKHGLQRSPRLS